MKKIQIFLFVLIIIGIVLLSTQKLWVPKLVDKIISYQKTTTPPKNNSKTEVPIIDGKYCFTRSQKATKEAPYAVEEKVVLDIKGNSITGTKNGTQKGPDMTNGYTGSLSGKREGSNFELTYSYTVEGSKNKELEIYELVEETLVKLRWPLVDKGGVLTPDKTSPPVSISFYTKEKCGV